MVQPLGEGSALGEEASGKAGPGIPSGLNGSVEGCLTPLDGCSGDSSDTTGLLCYQYVTYLR